MSTPNGPKGGNRSVQHAGAPVSTPPPPSGAAQVDREGGGTPASLRILLADDNPTFVLAVRQFLSTLVGTEVVGVAGNGRDAMALADSLRPDLLLLDIGMPEVNGLEAARRMQLWPDPPPVVFLSMHNGQAYRDAASQVGAVGFISKGDFVDELPGMIRAVEARRTPQNA